MSKINDRNDSQTSGEGLTRREALVVGAAAAVGATAHLSEAQGGVAASHRPVAVASKNGLEAVGRAVRRMEAGLSPVEAAVDGVGIVEADPEVIAHLLVHRGRDADPPRLRQTFQPRGDVHAVAVDPLALDPHVAAVQLLRAVWGVPMATPRH